MGSTLPACEITKMVWLVSQDFWWPDMKLDISAYVQGCTTCQANKNFPGNPKPPSFPIKTNQNALPFETITLDFITKLPESEGYDTILTIVDHDCSKAAFFIPCKETIDAKGVAALLAKTLFPHYGLPRRVISDRDTRLTAKLIKEWCDTLDIEQNISTAYHPQTDGQSERANQWVEQYLQMFINHQQDNWADLLPLAQYTHNSWPSATTKKTPYELILGYTPKMHQPQRTGNMPETKERLEQILEARRVAQAAITHAQSQYKDSPHFQLYSEGDKVWLDARNLKMMHPTFKLAPKRYGPFPITKTISVTTYALKLPPQWHIHPVFHASLLMPYKETPIHGMNFPEPPPDLIKGEPEWEVEKIVNTRCYRNQTQFLIKWKGYSDAHNSWEPEKNLNATELVEEYYKRNPRSVGAEDWIKRREISVHFVTTHLPSPPIITTMPSCDSSTERLVARAMARGSYSETTTESPESLTSLEATEEDYQPLPFSPENDNTIEMVIANLVNVAMTSPPSHQTDPPPIHQDFPTAASAEGGSVLRPAESTTTRPNTPVIHRLASTFERPT